MDERRRAGGTSGKFSFANKFEFISRQNEILDRIGLEVLMDYDEQAAEEQENLYRSIGNYAMNQHLLNTSVALPLIRGLLLSESEGIAEKKEDTRAFYMHALSVCQILIDLHLPMTKEEQDITLSAALCHVLPESLDLEQDGRELTDRFYLDPRVYEIVRLVSAESAVSDKDKRNYYERVQENRQALIIRLADRGNLAERLYMVSLWDAREFVRETREYYFSMCLYAKEHYPEMYGIVTIMMEKMRNLIDIVDILAARFQERETSLAQEILSLREENCRIRSVIARLREEKQYETI